MNRLDHAVNNIIKTNKDKLNVADENKETFDTSFNLSSGTRNSLPVVTVTLQRSTNK